MKKLYRLTMTKEQHKIYTDCVLWSFQYLHGILVSLPDWLEHQEEIIKAIHNVQPDADKEEIERNLSSLIFTLQRRYDNNYIEKSVSVVLNTDAIYTLARCTEDWCRFFCGQTELWHTNSRYTDLSKFKLYTNELKLIEPLVGSYDYAGNGCENKKQKKFICMTYPMYRDIIHYYTVKNNFSNCYSSPTLRCELQDKPIKIEEI